MVSTFNGFQSGFYFKSNRLDFTLIACVWPYFIKFDMVHRVLPSFYWVLPDLIKCYDVFIRFRCQVFLIFHSFTGYFFSLNFTGFSISLLH